MWLLYSNLLCLFLSSISADNQKLKSVSVNFTSCDSINIEGKIWLPDKSKSEKLAIFVSPCLVKTFTPEQSTELRFDLMLRNELLERGIPFFEFLGRKESIRIQDRVYPASTMLTKAQDLEAAVAFIRSKDEYKDKKLVLIGQSEGGATSSIVASKNLNINALLLLSTPGVSGKEFLSYQMKCKDSIFVYTVGTHSEVNDILNSLSSTNKIKYGNSFDEFERFGNDVYGPLIDIVDNYENSDTIAVHIMGYLAKKWSLEDELTKRLHKNFISYCTAHHHFAYIQPEQIALRKWNPDLYFPKIKCAVAVVYGTRDQNVEYSSSNDNIKSLLIKGKNFDFTSFILPGHDHLLTNQRIKPSIQDSTIISVVNWIYRQ